MINKGVVMRHDYDGTVGFDKNDSDSEFWEEANKYLGKVLMLPAGEYTIKAIMDYSLDENNILQTQHTQIAEVKVTVK